VNVTCGIDWAQAHHDVALSDEQGRIVARQRIDTGVGGYSQLLGLLAEHSPEPTSVPIAIETDKNLLVVALQHAGFEVYAINPRAVARYRERHAQAGKKSDAADAAVLAGVLRTDRHLHRPLPRVTDAALAVKALARQHQEAIWALHQTISRLRSLLLEYYPQALVAFPKLTHHAAMAVLAAAPTPDAAQRLTRRKIVSLLRGCGRRNDPTLVEQIHRDLHTPTLRQPEPVEVALGAAAAGLISVVTAMQAGVSALEDQLATVFIEHPLAAVLRSAPGLGPVLAARVLGEVGDDPTRFTTANGLRAFAGTAPITRASGRSHQVKARKVRNKRLGDACHWWALPRSPNPLAPGRSTTAAEQPVTVTTPHCATSPTRCSGDCGGACTPDSSGTRRPPGTSPRPRSALDD
jgi:transposase